MAVALVPASPGFPATGFPLPTLPDRIRVLYDGLRSDRLTQLAAFVSPPNDQPSELSLMAPYRQQLYLCVRERAIRPLQSFAPDSTSSARAGMPVSTWSAVVYNPRDAFVCMI